MALAFPRSLLFGSGRTVQVPSNCSQTVQMHEPLPYMKSLFLPTSILVLCHSSLSNHMRFLVLNLFNSYFLNIVLLPFLKGNGGGVDLEEMGGGKSPGGEEGGARQLECNI